MEKLKNGCITMWTTQAPIVLETIERDGFSTVKKEYIMKKYGTTAWIFRTAYDFFKREAVKKVPCPDGAESPFWIYKDARQPFRCEGSCLLELEVPLSEMILFDSRDWGAVLNLSYLGSEEEKNAFDKELARQGVSDSLQIFQKPFYPVLKKQVMDSWKKLFDKELPEDFYVEGAVWQIKKEWVKNVIML